VRVEMKDVMNEKNERWWNWVVIYNFEMIFAMSVPKFPTNRVAPM